MQSLTSSQKSWRPPGLVVSGARSVSTPCPAERHRRHRGSRGCISRVAISPGETLVRHHGVAPRAGRTASRTDRTGTTGRRAATRHADTAGGVRRRHVRGPTRGRAPPGRDASVAPSAQSWDELPSSPHRARCRSSRRRAPASAESNSRPSTVESRLDEPGNARTTSRPPSGNWSTR